MSESLNPEWPESPPPQAGASLPMTAGHMIRTARIQMGVHLAVLSVKLKVPIRQLEALEADEYDLTKGPVFVRALASSVCRHLRIDPAPVLDLLPKSVDRMPLQKSTLEAMNAGHRMQWSLGSVIRTVPLPTFFIATSMLLLIAAFLWLPSPSIWGWFNPVVSKAEPVSQALPVMPPEPEASAPSSSETATQPHATPAMPAPLAQVAPPVSLPAVAPASAPALSNAPATPTHSAASVSPSQGPVMVFSASNDSWIEIRDGKNQVLWSRVVHAGENAQVQYSPPLNVVIGRASAVSMTYKGKPFDLAPHTKVTVARFEVKE